MTRDPALLPRIAKVSQAIALMEERNISSVIVGATTLKQILEEFTRFPLRTQSGTDQASSRPAECFPDILHRACSYPPLSWGGSPCAFR